ncbi:hypothetical protein [Paenibacillus sp. NPDC055715]
MEAIEMFRIHVNQNLKQTGVLQLTKEKWHISREEMNLKATGQQPRARIVKEELLSDN